MLFPAFHKGEQKMGMIRRDSESIGRALLARQLARLVAMGLMAREDGEVRNGRYFA